MSSDSMCLQPAMGRAQVQFLKQFLSKGVVYLEFGCGASTVLAAESKARRIYSVDNSKEWIEKCRTHPSIEKRIKKGQAHIYFADVGAIGKWGKPTKPENKVAWPSYSAGVWLEMLMLPNVVFIDGRWRVACALQALWRCGDDVKILVHDWSKRPQYHEILEFADIEGMVGNLVCLTPRHDRDRGLIAARAFERMEDYS